MANLSQKLDIRLGQNLVMTPQLQQAIKMLQMTNQELSEFVLGEIEQNPLLERMDSETGLAEGESPVDAPLDNTERHSDGETPAGDNDGRSLDADYDSTGSGEMADDGRSDYIAEGTDFSRGGSDDIEGNWIEQTVSEHTTLRDHILEQIQLDITEPQQRLIALILMDHLDEAGYCKADVNTIAANLGVPVERVQEVLDDLQRLDPPGIFARDLSECLHNQLRGRGELTPAFKVLLQNLQLLGEKAYGQLEKLCGVNRDELGHMLQSIKTLNPKPATGFEGGTAAYAPTIIPDVSVKRSAKGEWLVELNQDTLPKVLINERYYAHVKEGTANKKELDYLADRYQSAQWLVKALHQRATTILKVATEIVKQQENFFSFGLDFLKPLTLKDVAGGIAMHESTVSRVTTAKYMATPKGVFELKYFFSTALAGTEGSGMTHAATAVKNRIKMLIDAEDPKKILSDDQLVTLLKAEGIDIARRTVAKYREAMGIGSSTERRRMKA
ncbi:MAG: RNA polymerase factor sigma-54 [Bdellovibrionales bacterium]